MGTRRSSGWDFQAAGVNRLTRLSRWLSTLDLPLGAGSAHHAFMALQAADNSFRRVLVRVNLGLSCSPVYAPQGKHSPRLTLDRYAKRAGRKIRTIRKRALDLLEAYSWPGNIRELQNVIERSLIVCETDEFTIDKSWLSNEPMLTRSADQTSIETPVPGERDLIEAALAQTRGKVSGLSGAAAKLGIPASTLESKIRSLRMNKCRFKEG
jgi:transcriptional regulator of acetoin/glycerol metabolism